MELHGVQQFSEYPIMPTRVAGIEIKWPAALINVYRQLIQIFDSHKVHLDGLMLKRSGFWTVHICYSDDVAVDGVTVRNNIGGKGPSVVIRDSIVRVGAAGVTMGSETSGGFRDIEAYNLRVLKPVPNGVLFKSARVRGGLTEDIRIHDLTLEGVAIPIHINLNWNPNYSYATMPPGLTDVPDY